MHAARNILLYLLYFVLVGALGVAIGLAWHSESQKAKQPSTTMQTPPKSPSSHKPAAPTPPQPPASGTKDNSPSGNNKQPAQTPTPSKTPQPSPPTSQTDNLTDSGPGSKASILFIGASALSTYLHRRWLIRRYRT